MLFKCHKYSDTPNRVDYPNEVWQPYFKLHYIYFMTLVRSYFVDLDYNTKYKSTINFDILLLSFQAAVYSMNKLQL